MSDMDDRDLFGDEVDFIGDFDEDDFDYLRRVEGEEDE